MLSGTLTHSALHRPGGPDLRRLRRADRGSPGLPDTALPERSSRAAYQRGRCARQTSRRRSACARPRPRSSAGVLGPRENTCARSRLRSQPEHPRRRLATRPIRLGLGARSRAGRTPTCLPRSHRICWAGTPTPKSVRPRRSGQISAISVELLRFDLSLGCRAIPVGLIHPGRLQPRRLTLPAWGSWADRAHRPGRDPAHRDRPTPTNGAMFHTASSIPA